MAGQGGAAAGAVGHHLVALVQQALVGHLLQAPPHRFDVVVVIGDVGVFHVGPEAHALGHALPFALVLPDALLALLDEGLDAVFLDLLLAVQAQQLFHLQLHRQAVGVPARLAGHQLALHRVVAGQQVLDGAGLDVADVGLAVGGRRAVVEGPDLLALPVFHGLLEDVVVVPELDDFLFTRQEIQRRGDLFDHPCVPPVKNNTPLIPMGRRRFAVPPRLAYPRDTPTLSRCNGRARRSLLPPCTRVRSAAPGGCPTAAASGLAPYSGSLRALDPWAVPIFAVSIRFYYNRFQDFVNAPEGNQSRFYLQKTKKGQLARFIMV